MACGDWMTYRLSDTSSVMILRGGRREYKEALRRGFARSSDRAGDKFGDVIVSFPNSVVLRESRQPEFEVSSSSSSSHLVPNWRLERRVLFFYLLIYIILFCICKCSAWSSQSQHSNFKLCRYIYILCMSVEWCFNYPKLYIHFSVSVCIF